MRTDFSASKSPFCTSVAKSCPTPCDPMECWLPCPSVSHRVCSNSCPLSQWCHLLVYPYSFDVLCSVLNLDIQREEEKVKRSVKDAAKKGQKDVCVVLAKEMIRSRKAVSKLYASKAHMNSVLMGMKNQLGKTPVLKTTSLTEALAIIITLVSLNRKNRLSSGIYSLYCVSWGVTQKQNNTYYFHFYFTVIDFLLPVLLK